MYPRRTAPARLGHLVRRCLLCLVVLGAASATIPAAADPLGSLRGDWRATREDSPLSSVELVPDDSGFRVRAAWRDGTLIDARLRPTSGAAVFSAESGQQGGFLDWLTSRESGGPLEGAPLIWARLEDDALILYRLEIAATGAFTLDRLALARRNGAVDAHLLRHRHAAAPLQWRGELAPRGAAR